MAAFGSGIKKELWVSIQGERAMRDKAKRALVLHKKAQTRLEAAKRKAERALHKEIKAPKKNASLREVAEKEGRWGLLAFGRGDLHGRHHGTRKVNAQIIGRRTFGPEDVGAAESLSMWRRKALMLDRAIVRMQAELRDDIKKKRSKSVIAETRQTLAGLLTKKQHAADMIATLSGK